MHELIPRDEERIIEISDTHWHMDYCEKGFGVEWGEECREFLVRVSLGVYFHFHFYLLGSVWLLRKLEFEI